MKTDYRKSLEALERACKEVLDAETLKAVVAAKRRIHGEPEHEIVSRRSIKIPIEIVPTCSMAAMREALKQIHELLSIVGSPDTAMCIRYEAAYQIAAEALASPPRNCDRPECATTKSAQEVWRKEDGGKTAYYEWLLATSTKGVGK